MEMSNVKVKLKVMLDLDEMHTVLMKEDINEIKEVLRLKGYQVDSIVPSELDAGWDIC